MFSATVVAIAWIYNIWCWYTGISEGFFLLGKGRILMASRSLWYTALDIGGVLLVRFLLGPYSMAMVPGSIIAIFISFWMKSKRIGPRQETAKT